MKINNIVIITLTFIIVLITSYRVNSATNLNIIIPNDYHGIADIGGEIFGHRFDKTDDELAVLSRDQMRDGSITIFENENGNWIQKYYILPPPGEMFETSISMSNTHMAIGSVNSIGTGNDYVHILKKINGKWVYSEKLTSPNGVDDQQFGYSVKISENHMFIGARFQNDADIDGAGAVYYYKLIDGNWIAQSLIRGNDDSSETFGNSIDIYGEYAIIGAPKANNGGKAYVYKLINNDWILQQELYSNIDDDLNFAANVNIDNNRILICSLKSYYIFEKINNKWVFDSQLISNDSPFNNVFFSSFGEFSENEVVVTSPRQENANEDEAGAIYVFEKINNSWIETQKIIDSAVEESYRFGSFIMFDNNELFVSNLKSASNNTVGVIHSLTKQSNQWSFNQNIISEHGMNNARFGSVINNYDDTYVVATNYRYTDNAYGVYVLNRNNNLLNHKQTLPNPGTDDFIPVYADIYDDKILVSSKYLFSPSANLIYSFIKAGNDWVYNSTISNPEIFHDDFAKKFTMFGNYAAVAAEGDQGGVVYIYEFMNDEWIEKQQIRPSDNEGGRFGFSLRIYENRLVISAPWQNDREGTVYIYELDNTGSWVEQQKIFQSNPSGSRDYFGSDMALFEDTIISFSRNGIYYFKYFDQMWTEIQKIELFSNNNGLPGSEKVDFDGDKLVITNDLGTNIYQLEDGLFTFLYKYNAPVSNIINNYANSLYGESTIQNDLLVLGSITDRYLGDQSGAIHSIDISKETIFVNGYE